MFDHMVPAHIARRVGWNHGFDTFNPAVDLSAGPMMVAVGLAGRTAVLVRNPEWWGTPSVLDRGDRQRGATIRRPGSATLASEQRGRGHSPSRFDLGSLDAVSSLPNTQSAVKPSLNLLRPRVQCHVARDVDGWRPARPSPTPSTGPPARPDLRLHRSGPGGQPGPPGHCRRRPATASRRRPASTARRISATTDRSSGASGSTRIRRAHYVDAAGKPLTSADGGRDRRSVDRPRWRTEISRATAAGRDRAWSPSRSTARRDGRGGGGQLLRHGPGHPGDQSLPDDHGGLVLGRPGRRGIRPAPRTGASSTTPRSTSCSSRRPRPSTR